MSKQPTKTEHRETDTQPRALTEREIRVLNASFARLRESAEEIETLVALFAVAG